jgi:hypothetical protein
LYLSDPVSQGISIVSAIFPLPSTTRGYVRDVVAPGGSAGIDLSAGAMLTAKLLSDDRLRASIRMFQEPLRVDPVGGVHRWASAADASGDGCQMVMETSSCEVCVPVHGSAAAGAGTGGAAEATTSAQAAASRHRRRAGCRKVT